MKKIIFFSKNLCVGGMEKSLVVLLNNLTSFSSKLTLLNSSIKIKLWIEWLGALL